MSINHIDQLLPGPTGLVCFILSGKTWKRVCQPILICIPLAKEAKQRTLMRNRSSLSLKYKAQAVSTRDTTFCIWILRGWHTGCGRLFNALLKWRLFRLLFLTFQKGVQTIELEMRSLWAPSCNSHAVALSKQAHICLHEQQPLRSDCSAQFDKMPRF